ncbi:MAG: carboxy-S-adenosyl-L-methionine synthase CmoA [Rhodospirillales bacterium]
MSDSTREDKFFADDMKVEDFVFDKKVATVFDDMVSRSVPLYADSQRMELQLATEFVQPGSNVYDIGCSTGTLLSAFSELMGEQDANLIGIDNSAPMLDEARKKIEERGQQDRISFVQADAEKDMGMENASVVFMNYTLQFVRPLYRESVVKQIYNSLNDHGCFLFIEKVLGNDSLFNRLYIELYYEYKRTVGYSDKEIRQKREALENVLIPYRLDENIELLERCGFGSIDVFYKWYNWAGFIAVKTPV